MKFNKTYENINLTVEVISWNDIKTVVRTRIRGNAAPAILNIDGFADIRMTVCSCLPSPPVALKG